MKSIPKSISGDELLEKICLRICQAVYRVNVGLTLSEGKPLVTEDLSNVTVQKIMDKIKDFIDSGPIDEHYNIFLHYLVNYPVSMCKHQVSPILKLLIGLHYRLGQMFKEEYEAYGKVNPVSMQDLAQIFGRSKATIHDCIKDTEEAWKHFLEFKEKQEKIEAKAERELIQEAKERLRKEKAVENQVLKKQVYKMKKQTNERSLPGAGG